MPRKKVLVVDDDTDLLRVLGVRLRASGFDVVFAADGTSAVAKARSESPDLVILDLGLPAGDGFWAMEQFEKLPGHSIPVLVLTGKEPRLTRDRALEAGAGAFVQKAADHNELLDAAMRLLGGSHEASAEVESPVADEPKAVPKRVLIVEDDEDLLRATGIRLKSRGYDVDFATSAVLAVRRAASHKPDLIILDIGLPGGDGFWVMDQLMFVAGASIPVIIVTGREPLVNGVLALRAGVEAFLQKPVDDEELLTAVRKALERNAEPASERTSVG